MFIMGTRFSRDEEDLLPDMTPKNSLKAVCIMRDHEGKIHGRVDMKSAYPGVEFSINIWSVPEGTSMGKHGLCVYTLGEEINFFDDRGGHFHASLAEVSHGGLNQKVSHDGDLGNIIITPASVNQTTFIARYLSLDNKSIYGRSLVLLSDEDDLGQGNHSDSNTTGHAGKYLLAGVIGRSR